MKVTQQIEGESEPREIRVLNQVRYKKKEITVADLVTIRSIQKSAVIALGREA